MKKLLFALLLIFVSCSSDKPRVEEHEILAPIDEITTTRPLGEEVKLYATWYNMPYFTSVKVGYKVRGMDGKALGPILTRKNWCDLAMEGTGFIDGKTYNYAGTTRKHVIKCAHRASGYVKFNVSKYQYGVGNHNNPLRPFVSVACDQKKFKYGQKFFVPSAKGVELPNGKKHNGYFVCEDVGGLIKGNHIDVFIGKYTKNPFHFVKSTESGTFKAYKVGK